MLAVIACVPILVAASAAQENQDVGQPTPDAKQQPAAEQPAPVKPSSEDSTDTAESSPSETLRSA